MKAGVLGVGQGEFGEVESTFEEIHQDGYTFKQCLEIQQSDTTDKGRKVQIGEAATQRIENKETITITDDNGITASEAPEKDTRFTEFLAVPDEFVVVKSGSGTFAFNLIQQQYPGSNIERAELDLNEFAEDYYEASNPWKVGFYGNLGNAEKGVVYGEDVFGDDEIGEVLDRSQLNQLGLQYEYEDQPLKMTMAESGYVEVYSPSNFDEFDYVDYIADEILNYQKTDQSVEATIS
ncbi:hypothetical protein DMJ13_20115 [halophilic archaeon]|nr:hypothetical protein DMJ13_20115 [halophilic archaeon]